MTSNLDSPVALLKKIDRQYTAMKSTNQEIQWRVTKWGIGSHEVISLLLAGTPGPQGPKGSDRLVLDLCTSDRVIIEVELLRIVPQILVDLSLSPLAAFDPFVLGLLPTQAPFKSTFPIYIRPFECLFGRRER